MVKTKREYILGACVLSGIGAIVSFISLGTDEWVSGEIKTVITGTTSSWAGGYGLFKGIVEYTGAITATSININMVCQWDKNRCALLTSTDEDNNFLDRVPDDEKLINAGAYVVTILFLVVSAFLGIVSAGLAVWNAATNPISVMLSISGLFIFNGLAALFNILYLMVWGIAYSVTIADNLAVSESMLYDNTSQEANLGYSYWISLIPMFCYGGANALLYVRRRAIAKEPDQNAHLENDVSDATIYIY